jgi:2-polyprenyl-3-methyl-5-hydroxy-6-metoxy-1,4-benzoquinol methylase
MYSPLDACPLCDHRSNRLHLQVRDYLVSGETFDIQKCASCGFLFTNPRPQAHEIGKYYQSSDYISHADTGFSIKTSAYALARKFMVNKKLRWINALPLTGQNLLDYGCGVGTFLKYSDNNGWNAYGVEPSENAYRIAFEKLGDRVQTSLSALSDKEFDVITLWHVLEHIHDLQLTVEQLLSTLKPKGWMLVAVPNPDSYDAKYYQEFWAGYDVPRHLYHFVPETMKFLAKKHRLQLVRTIPLKLDAYYVCLLSEKYRKGTIWKALYQGFRSNQHAKSHQANYSSLVYLMRK